MGKEALRLLRDGEDGLLRGHLLSERNLREDDLILFMREFIGYVAMLSDFPEEKRNHALAIFPPIRGSEYACIEGARDRLQEAVKFLRKVEMTPRERMIFDVHNEIVEEARIKFSPFVYEGGQPHLIPAINYLFGFGDATKRQAKHTALEIPAEKAWQEILGYPQAFIRKCRKRLEGVFEMIRQKRNPTEGSNWTEAERVLESVGLKPEDIVEEGDGQYRWSKEKVVNLFPKMRLENLITLRPPLSLFDLDAPQKIAALLDSDIGANREMGVDALLLMGRQAQRGSSPIQFINTVHAVGMRKRGELDLGDVDMGVIELRSLSERFRKSNPSLSNKISVAALSLNPWRDILSSYMKYLEHDDAKQVSISEVFFGNAPAEFTQKRIELSSAEELNDSPINLDRVFHNPSRLSNLDQFLHSRHGALSLEKAQYIGAHLTVKGIKFQDIEIIQYVSGGFCRADESDEARLNRYRDHPNLSCQEDVHIALYFAASKGLTEVVTAFINRGAGVDLASPTGSTALMIASAKGRVATVNTLLDGGANIDLTNQSGLSAAAIATYNNRAEVVATLANRGANLDLVSRHGLTALMIAARKGHVAIVGVLLEGGADFNLVNREGRTALMMASREHNEGVVDLLSSYASAFDERHSLDQSISATPTATLNVTASNAVAPASDISCTIS